MSSASLAFDPVGVWHLAAIIKEESFGTSIPKYEDI